MGQPQIRVVATVRIVVELVRLCIRTGTHFTIENPSGSALCSKPPYSLVAREVHVKFAFCLCLHIQLYLQEANSLCQ